MDEEPRELIPFDTSVPALPTAEQLAARVITVMDIIADRMQLESPHPATSSRVRGARTVPREFVIALTAAVESMPEFQKLGFDAAESREVLQATETYREIAQRTALLLASMNYTIEARWSKLVTDAMITFSIASIKARDPGQGALAARVESLRKLLRRGGRKKKKQEAAKGDGRAE